MDFSQSQSHRHPSKRNKKRLTYDQLRLLETNFNHDTRLEPERKIQLARELGLPPRQIAIWYQNKRARWKTQSLELSYRSIQIKLDNALADKRRLESEMGTLREELERTQQMLLGLHPSPPSISSFLTSCDENGSSSLPDDRNYSWENDRVLQVEELYACLMD